MPSAEIGPAMTTDQEVRRSNLFGRRMAKTASEAIAGIAGAGLTVLAATWALVTLRRAAAKRHLAAEHEHELVH